MGLHIHMSNDPVQCIYKLHRRWMQMISLTCFVNIFLVVENLSKFVPIVGQTFETQIMNYENRWIVGVKEVLIENWHNSD